MQRLVPPDTELLGGLELGGIPLATVISSLTGIPAVFVREKAKQYGTRRLAEGAEVAGRRICLIEDIVTTGGAARDATRVLRAGGATVSALVCTIDRSETPGRALTDVGVDNPWSTRDDLASAILEWIEASYIPRRRHQPADAVPYDYELLHETAETAA